jgi:hypothetical protein
MDNDLKALIAAAMERQAAMSPQERENMRQQQIRGWVIAEMGMGDDEDEAAYRAASLSGDRDAIGRLDEEAKDRMERAARYFDAAQ